MPKGKKKTKSAGYKKPESTFASEEESVADTASVISNVSELRIDSDDDTTTKVDPEITLIDNFEAEFEQAIEGTLKKSAKSRIKALKTIHSSLASRCMGDFLNDRKLTICDSIERNLKRGSKPEQLLAAELPALLCTQLNSVEDSELVFKTLHPTLLTILHDDTEYEEVRAQVASSLGICCFISCPGAEIIQSTMDALFSVFKKCFIKNGVVAVFNEDVCYMHICVLLSWTLLLTLLSPPYIMTLANKLDDFIDFLENEDVDVRIAAGETFAVFYELARQCREDFETNDFTYLCNQLKQLATDGQKSRAKKARRLQRSSFRDFLKAVEGGEPPDIRIKLKDETLYIDSWCSKRRYDAFCSILGGGINHHLKQNELLREIFELGPPLMDDKPALRMSKLHRQSAHIANFKARTICRGKDRDNKAEDIC